MMVCPNHPIAAVEEEEIEISIEVETEKKVVDTEGKEPEKRDERKMRKSLRKRSMDLNQRALTRRKNSARTDLLLQRKKLTNIKLGRRVSLDQC